MQFAKRWSISFSAEVPTGIKCLVLQKKLILQSLAHHLQKKNYAARLEKPTGKKDMSILAAMGNWNIAKGKLKQKFAQLTGDELQFIEGKQDELVGRIQKRTGRSGETEIIKRFANECCGCKH